MKTIATDIYFGNFIHTCFVYLMEHTVFEVSLCVKVSNVEEKTKLTLFTWLCFRSNFKVHEEEVGVMVKRKGYMGN